MPAESERPPYFNGDSGRTRGAKDVEVASDPAHRSAKEQDMMVELPRSTVKSSQAQAMSQVPPKFIAHIPVSTSTSTTNSAVSSRESSPVRNSSRTLNSSSTSRVHSQSRRSSQDRSSPIRSSSSNGHSPGIPINSSGQRAPAHLNHPPILSPPPAPDPPANVLGPEKANMPAWAGTYRRMDQASTPPNTSHKRTPLPPPEEHGLVDRSTPRAVATRAGSGAGLSLETVEEMASNPSTPSSDMTTKPVTPDDSRLHTIDEDPTPRASRHGMESECDSICTRSSEALTEDSRSQAADGAKTPKTLMPQRSTTSLSAGARGKPADGSVRNMIVETETVSSIPQVSLGVGAGERGNVGRPEQGTLKNKKSSDTVRAPVPRNNPQKRKRRNNALPAGPTSKADVFEAKVASAVDEADVSDSDETFVYESNPIDYPPRRYHSRTPSATSMASQVDQLAGRARGAMRDGNHSVVVKRSMKFTNNTYLDGEAVESDSRSASRAEGSGTITPGRGYHHHHIGPRTRPPSIMDNDGLFPQAQGQKSPRHFISGHRHSRNSNTRSAPHYRTITGSKKASDMYGYDFDAEGADDERTPLVPRPPRSSRGDRSIRRPGGTSRQIEYITQRQNGYFSRYGSCTIIILLLLIIAGGAVSFFIAASKALLDVQVVAIQNVLASEQEIMLDLNVSAVNPNIFPVTIDDTDLNIFAKSRYVGTDKFWREHPSDELDRFPRVTESRRRWQFSQTVRCLGNMDCVEAAKSHTKDGVDKGTDPITDPEGDSQTMLLGRVFRFDSPLSFASSPWDYEGSTSKGQIRLPRPGNKTEEGGTERWERVLQHPFELIVRGVIKYQVPLSSRYLSASISSSVRYVPDDEDSNDPNTTPPGNDTARISDTTTPSSSTSRLVNLDLQL
ncbi:hypothetical protein N7488_007118 [Penicillium malachiteum]|nr:hypothetical protein N7488_007118 [Penicillium malachiteum]